MRVTSRETRTKLRWGPFSAMRRAEYERIHDFEEPLWDTAVFHRFLRNVEMNSSELASVVAEVHDLSKAQAQAILDSVLKIIVKAAASDDEVS